MGAGASTMVNIRNNYTITGNNNGITGDTGVYGTTTGASTDVKPTTDMNYSDHINPDFGGAFGYIASGLKTKLIGTVSKTPNLLDAARHIGSAAYRVAMGDEDLKDVARDLVQEMTTVEDGSDVVSGKEQIDVSFVKKLSDLQAEVVKKLPEVHDAYAALALGMTGIRNSEVNTKPTTLSLAACFERASEGEKLNAENIIDAVGARMGVISRSVDASTSTIISETLDNTMTEHGNVGDLRIEGAAVAEIQRGMKCSILHASGRQLSEAGLMMTDSWETNDIIGIIKQHSVPVEGAEIQPGGFVINTQTGLVPLGTVIGDGATPNIGFLCTTPIAYDIIDKETDFRDVYLVSSGRVTIADQPYNADVPIEIGFVIRDPSSQYRFHAAHFINTDVYKAKNANVSNIYSNTDHLIRFYSATEAKNNLKDAVTNGTRFSYDSVFQVTVNLTQLIDFYTDQLYTTDRHYVGPMRAFMVVALPAKPEASNSVKMNISVGPPSVRIETVTNPLHFSYNGSPYRGSILDLVGTVPNWYSTSDHHDPVYMYKKLVEPLIPYLGLIADLHLDRDGAALNLSRSHVVRAFNKVVGLDRPISTTDLSQVDAKIRQIIIRAHDLLYQTGPLAMLPNEDAKILIMHFVEKVINQVITHIHVWSDRTAALRDNYSRDCREFNAIELDMDKRAVASTE